VNSDLLQECVALSGRQRHSFAHHDDKSVAREGGHGFGIELAGGMRSRCDRTECQRPPLAE
jgi:hypothetical protein